jgi:hypothetical protein
MKLYADRPFRRAVQMTGDLFALALTVFAVWLAVEVHTQVMRLRTPGDRLIDAGSGLRGTFDSAADKAITSRWSARPLPEHCIRGPMRGSSSPTPVGGR